MKKTNNIIQLERGWTAFILCIVVLFVVTLLVCCLEMSDKLRYYLYIAIAFSFVCTFYLMLPRGELRLDESGIKITTRSHRVKRFYSWDEIVFIQYHCHRKEGILTICKEKERITLAIDYFLPDGYIINGRTGYCERLDCELDTICKEHHVDYVLLCSEIKEERKKERQAGDKWQKE